MRINFFLALSFFFVVLSCEKDIPFPEVSTPPVLVANALITPDSIWQINLSKSMPIDSSINFETVVTGTVTIENLTTNQLIQLAHRGNGIYSANSFLPEQGHMYQLSAQAPNFLTITATSAIPKAFSVQYLKGEKSFFKKEANYLLDLAIKDNEEEANFYLIEAQYLLENQNHSILENATVFSFDSNSSNESIVADHSNFKRSFLTDENFNGQNYTTQIGATSALLENLSPEDHLTAIISVKSITQDGYEYYKSLTRFENLEEGIFTEPLSVFSKIENGYGIFAGYTEQRLEIILQ